MKKIKIKISDIHHLTDARYFSSKEVEYLGFDRLSTASNDIKLIQEWIYGPQIVSEFIGNNCIVDIQKMMTDLETEVVHFDHFVDYELLSKFQDYEIFVDVHLQLEGLPKTKRRMELLSSSVDYFVLKSDKQFCDIQDNLNDFISDFPCYIDFPFSLEDVPSILNMQVEGVVLRGGMEERVGVKSFEELDDILNLLTGVE